MNIKLIAAVVVVFAAVVGAYYLWAEKAHAPGQTACTQEAMQCPDGSYVGRTGPNCEFSPCPGSGGTKSNKSLNASPASGSAPLAVTFTSVYGDSQSEQPSHLDGQDTVIDFGDGTELEWVQCAGSGGVCTTPARVQHTYTSVGTFSASLKKNGGLCLDGPCPSPVLGTVSVIVR